MKKATALALLLIPALFLFSQKSKQGNIILNAGWAMQSAIRVSDAGDKLSQPGYATQSWFPVDLPSTVIAGLLKNKQYNFDPFYGDNLLRIAGPEFDSSWWFRKEFTLPASEKDKNISLILHGINYRANVWLNGVMIADSNEVIGPFRIFEFDITKQLKHGSANVLAIQIRRPFNPNRRDGDLAIDYADWIHYPADFNGGIVNNVELQTCDKVAIRYPLVSTHFDLPSTAKAHLSVLAELTNYSETAQDVVVSGKINDQISFSQKVKLAPREMKTVSFENKQYPQLTITNPRIWWPWQYGKPQLNSLEMQVSRQGKIASHWKENFGIREVSSVMIDSHSRKFIVNGKPILLRGAAWSPDIFQRRSENRQEQEIKLVRDMNMNLVRSEGKLEDDHFYDLCDQYGLLVMTGWMCCGSWQHPERWDSTKRHVAMESQRSVMYWLRNKACLMVWLNGSDMPPRDTTVESDWLKIERELQWQNPILSTADESVSKVSGPSGVKMNGPYDWVPPIYWETDTAKYGGAWSFATEISPGPSIPPYESLIRFIPKDSLIVNNGQWLYHCGTMQFGNTRIFDTALDKRYGPSSTIQEYVAKAQVQNYEAHRAMMEAFGLNKYRTATGVVQWMLSNPWPSLIWHTYDYYLYPAGTYFGMKKSMEPLHVQYSYKSRGVSINNSTGTEYTKLKVTARMYDAGGQILFSKQISTNAAADAIQNCFAIPEAEGNKPVYFLRLQLDDAQNNPVSINWYWLSATNDSLNWAKSKWYYTPQSAFADFSSLKQLPATHLQVAVQQSKGPAETSENITLTNKGKSVAFFVHIRLLNKKGGDDILPVIFDDNYLLLAPGETRKISGKFLNKDASGGEPFVSVSGWNLDQPASQWGEHSGYEQVLPSR